jgi:hypothetical protein
MEGAIMKPTIQELDAAIEYLEPFSKEIPLISEYDTPEDIEWDKKRIMVNNLSYTALKFMRLMMEPSEIMCREAIWKYEDMMGGCRLPDGEGYDHDIVKGMIKATTTQALKEVQGE